MSTLTIVFILPNYCRVHASEAKELAVSTPAFPLGDIERVVAFRCTVHGGRIVRLSNVPDLWEVEIENGNADTATLTASVLVGAAALAPGETEGKTSYFRKFLVIQKTLPPLNPFSIAVDVNISTNETMTKFRKLDFRGRLILSPINSEE
jgi:hypothetical protein